VRLRESETQRSFWPGPVFLAGSAPLCCDASAILPHFIGP